MANTIKIKRGSGSDPAASDMVLGEPVLRTDTAELFFKKDDGSVAKVSGGGGGPDFKYLALRNAANNGAASYPNADFTLVTSGTTTAITPAAANTLLVSVNGVIQKPNTGTSTPSQGFALSGSTIKFGANISAAPDFILYQESGGIGEPSDETVSEEKLKVSNSPVNGYFLSAQSGNTGGLTWAAPVATSCTGNSATATALATARAINGVNFDGTAAITVTAAAGTLSGTTLNSSVVTSSLTSLGDLAGLTVIGTSEFTANVKFDGATAGRDITFLRSTNTLRFQDNTVLSLGDSDDFKMFHNGSITRFVHDLADANLEFQSDNFVFKDKDNGDVMAKMIHDGAVELYHNGTKKFQTASNGAQVIGSLGVDELYMGDNEQIKIGAEDDFLIYHGGSENVLDGVLHKIELRHGSEKHLVANPDGAVELYYDNVKQLSTRSDGIEIHAPEGGEAGLYLTADAGDDTNDKYRLIAQNSGDLVFQRHTGSAYSSELRLKSAGGIQANFQGSNKFETSSTGVTVTGKVSATSIFCDDNTDTSMDTNPSGQVVFGGNGYTGAIALDGSNMNIYHNASARGIQFGIHGQAVARFDTSGHFLPAANNAKDLGSSSLRWRKLYSTGLNVNGGTTPATITHTGGNALTLSRSSKNLNFNANYGAANTHATIDVTSGMELRFQVAGSDRVKLDSSGHWLPTTNNARDLGSTSLRWRNVYTNDLNLSNEGGSNDVDGTWGSYTIQEGAEDLFLVNKRNGKKYKFNLTEVS